MIKSRILATLKFFDLQDYPLTLLELHRFLISDSEKLKTLVDSQGEIIKSEEHHIDEIKISLDEVLKSLDTECKAEVESYLGFYFLTGKKNIAQARLDNYFYGIKREKFIKRFIGGLQYLPFIRGAALAGSQAMGLQKPGSDIDLLVITDPQFLWLARTLVTAYFHMFGQRRHGEKIANRFCLNHYLAGPKEITQFRNLYTAAEYLKLRALVYPWTTWAFQQENSQWITSLYPNANISQPANLKPSKAQHILEHVFTNKFGLWLDQKLKNWQLPKIRQEKFILVTDDELSFHPQSKQQQLLLDFFGK